MVSGREIWDVREEGELTDWMIVDKSVELHPEQKVEQRFVDAAIDYSCLDFLKKREYLMWQVCEGEQIQNNWNYLPLGISECVQREEAAESGVRPDEVV